MKESVCYMRKWFIVGIILLIGLIGVAGADKTVVDYSANQTCHIGKPMVVQFASNCGEPDVALWDFGEGNISSDYDPVFIYQEYGVYPVNLSCTNTTYGEAFKYRPEYIILGVEGTFCTNGGCGELANNDTVWYVVVAVISAVATLLFVKFRI
jgi:PKD repeat protein